MSAQLGFHALDALHYGMDMSHGNLPPFRVQLLQFHLCRLSDENSPPGDKMPPCCDFCISSKSCCVSKCLPVTLAGYLR